MCSQNLIRTAREVKLSKVSRLLTGRRRLRGEGEHLRPGQVLRAIRTDAGRAISNAPQWDLWPCAGLRVNGDHGDNWEQTRSGGLLRRFAPRVAMVQATESRQ